MNVALDATPLILSSGGLVRYVTELSLALAAEFPDDMYSLLSDQPFDTPAGAPRNLTRWPASGRRWWLHGVRKAIRNSGAQVFHGANFEVPYLGNTPAILTIHDLSPWRDPAWHNGAERVRRRTPWLIRLGRATVILTVSEAVRKEVIDRFHVRPDTVRAVPLAASSAFKPAPPEAPPPERPYFLFVGTLEPRKNIPALIEAWRATRSDTRADLVIAGRVRSGFIPPSESEGLRILGEIPDSELPRLYSNALACVYPTHYEGFGLPVLEAMQCGCPVITSKDPAVTEVAAGAALQAANASEVAGFMRAIASKSELGSDLRRAGLARASAFSWRNTARQTRAIYAELAGAGA